jgi:hypothetical protein
MQGQELRMPYNQTEMHEEKASLKKAARGSVGRGGLSLNLSEARGNRRSTMRFWGPLRHESLYRQQGIDLERFSPSGSEGKAIWIVASQPIRNIVQPRCRSERSTQRIPQEARPAPTGSASNLRESHSKVESRDRRVS